MREILFRGKCLRNNQWVYGSYIDHYGVIRDENQDYDIDLNTLGQFTNLCDRNGKKIFEGDIVNCRVLRLSANDTSWSRKTNIEHGKCRTIPMEIYYIEPYTECYQRFGGIGFRPTKKALELIKEYEKPIGRETNKQQINYYNIEKDDLIEIIGDIYDNPELLGDEDA